MTTYKHIPIRTESDTSSEVSSARVDDTNKDTYPSLANPAIAERQSMKPTSEQVFVKTHDADDVFGDHPTVPAMPDPDSKRVTTAATAANELSGDPLASTDVPAPRPDRIMSPITPANAQGLLPPEACVFAANFSMMRSDEQLEFSCHQAFDVFGRCVVKVRRDKHRHPFAMIQFYNAADATSAIEGSRGLMVDGRRIRTEPAQARRAVIFVKVDGSCPTHEEAQNILGAYGPIEKIHPTTNGDASRMGIPPGLWVQFIYYLDYKDTVKFFNTRNTEYQVHTPPEPAPRMRATNMGSPMAHVYRSPRSPTDQKSIFVGNLPQDATEFELHELFSQFGNIRALNLIHKPVLGGVGYNVFAFVEYSDATQAARASEQEFDLRGQRIRVEPKEYSARRNNRIQQQFAYPQAFASPPQYAMPNTYQSPGGMMHYNPEYQHIYHIPSTAPTYGNSQEVSPYHGNHFNNRRVYTTPPSSNRVGRGSQMPRSPENVPFFSPFQNQGHYSNMGASQGDYGHQHH